MAGKRIVVCRVCLRVFVCVRGHGVDELLYEKANDARSIHGA